MPTPVETFRALHQTGCFVLPNPWDTGSARILESLGFKALATTSAALAFSRGCIDSPTSLGRAATLENITEIARATALPVNADFQAGFGDTPEDVATSVTACLATGVAGLSIEDATGDAARPLFERSEALERLRAAREAIDASGRDVVLTGRAECFLVDHPRALDESLERLSAYAAAGADCLYAPGLRTKDDVTAVVAAAGPKPVNVLMTDPTWMTVASLEALGVRRISVGSALARAAWTGFLSAARDIASSGRFEELATATPFDTLNAFFAESGAESHGGVSVTNGDKG